MNHQTILLVEDDPNDIFFMKRCFNEAGVLNPPDVVENGRDAIAYLSGTGEFQDRSRYPLPSLVLLDLKLPYVLGLDVLKWIRSQPALDSIAITVLVSSKDDIDIEEAYHLGANSYLVKPPDPGKLIDILRQTNGYSAKQTQGPESIAFAHPEPTRANQG